VAGSYTVAHTKTGQVRRITITATADASNGSYPAIPVPGIDGRLIQVATNPGSPAPTANWDLALNDEDGFDLTGGNGQNRHTTNTEQVALDKYISNDEGLSLVITGNSVNSAVIVIRLKYVSLLPY